MSLKVFIFSKEHSAHSKNREQRMRQLVAYGKQLTVTPKKWSQSLTEGGRLLEVPTVRLWLGKFGLLDWQSHMEVGLCKPPSPHCEWREPGKYSKHSLRIHRIVVLRSRLAKWIIQGRCWSPIVKFIRFMGARRNTILRALLFKRLTTGNHYQANKKKQLRYLLDIDLSRGKL